jgi:hypothetical protein
MTFQADPYSTLEIGAVSVDSPAWFCLNKQELFDVQPPQRGQNIAMPGVDGLIPVETFDDEVTVDLRWVITGNVSPQGDPYEDAAVGLKANKRLFISTYFRATRDSFGCVLAEGTDVDGEEVEGRVQLGPPQFSEGLFECGVVMSVLIPGGELKVSGS